jgi:hypothetical protein
VRKFKGFGFDGGKWMHLIDLEVEKKKVVRAFTSQFPPFPPRIPLIFLLT